MCPDPFNERLSAFREKYHIADGPLRDDPPPLAPRQPTPAAVATSADSDAGGGDGSAKAKPPTQVNLFDPVPDRPGRGKHPCSQAAAAKVAPAAGSRSRRILDFVAGRGFIGATREEIADGLSIRYSSICGLVRPLLDAHLLIEVAEKRPTSSGSPATVLRIPRTTDGGTPAA